MRGYSATDLCSWPLWDYRVTRRRVTGSVDLMAIAVVVTVFGLLASDVIVYVTASGANDRHGLRTSTGLRKFHNRYASALIIGGGIKR